VSPLLVDAGTAVGVAVGVLLDPVGQRLADRSRAVEEQRRAERTDRRAAAATAEAPGAPAAGGPAPVPELVAGAVDRTPASEDREDAAPGHVTDGGPGGEGPPVPVRHLLAEGRSLPRMLGAGAVTGLLFGLSASRLSVHGHGAGLLLVLPFWVFLAVAVTVSVTDLTHRLVPRQLVYGALACIVPLLVLVSAHLQSWRPLGDAALAGVGAFAVFFVIWFLVPRGMGFGDVRLSGVIGVTVGYLGLLQAYLAFLIGFVLGLVFGLVLMVGSGSGRKTRIPFAPALCVGAAIAILWGAPLARHVFHVSN
jgi:leader peptidase (prepilin peptidase)/N-methyltransferase